MTMANTPQNNTHKASDLHADAEFLSQVEAPVLELHRSNVLRLEVDELLQECRCDLSHTSSAPVSWSKAAHFYVHTLEQLVREMMRNTEHNTRTSACPFRLQSDKITSLEPLLKDRVADSEMPWTFVPALFSASHTVGLTTKAGNAHVLPTLECTLLIRKDFFHSKDYLHHRYFDTRNLMLWQVALYLSQSKFQSTIGSVEWYYGNGNERTPCLLLTPPTGHDDKKSKKKKRKVQKAGSTIRMPRKIKFRVQLSLAMESHEWIPRSRLFPNRTNLGASSVLQTPTYNFDLVADSPLGRGLVKNQTTGHYHLEWEELVNVSGSHSHFMDALILVKVWCLQRGLLRGHDTFTMTTLSLLLVYLYRTKHVTPRMAPLQVFTVMMKFLAETDWLGEAKSLEKNDATAQLGATDSNLFRHSPSEAYVANSGLSLNKRAALVLPLAGLNEAQTISQCAQARLYTQQLRDSPMTSHDPPTLLQCFKQFTDGPVFLDSTMSLNFLGRVSPAYIREIQQAALITVQCLHTHSVTRPFSFMFLSSARFWTSMDVFFELPLRQVDFGRSKLWGKDRDDVGEFESIARGLVNVLRFTLGDRVLSIRILTTGNGSSKTVDSDQIPTNTILPEKGNAVRHSLKSPLGNDTLVVGLRLNPDTCHRLVDRGPPADNSEATKGFVELWGSEKAQLRRFKDGAIVHAAVWNTPAAKENYVPIEGDDKTLGGIVERIVRHVLSYHFLKPKQSAPQFRLKEMLSLVDGITSPGPDDRFVRSSAVAHRRAMTAFDSLSEFLRKHSALVLPVVGSGNDKVSRLGLPLPIDGVEPLSPALRYAELFPPVPHPHLGGGRTPGTKKTAGAIMFSPILFQIRFGMSSKWPTDLKAMDAAKTAMLIQLADGIDAMKRTGTEGAEFEGPMQVTPGYMDFGYKGYLWRIVVRADPELHMLQGLQTPNPEAVSLLHLLRREHIIRVMHHSSVHAVHSAHPSAGSVTRLAKRWIASHMMSGMILPEAVELLVSKVYSDRNRPLAAPATLTSGFMRFLELLALHDWVRDPLIVDPQGHLSEEDHTRIRFQFEKSRGSDYRSGPPMYVVSPNDRWGRGDDAGDETRSRPDSSGSSRTPNAVGQAWAPTFTEQTPEWVVLKRASSLAKRSHDYLTKCLETDAALEWSAVFHETRESLKSYSALLRVAPDFLVDSECSSTGSDVSIRTTKAGDERSIDCSYTRSMRERYLGPVALRRKLYRNLNLDESSSVIHCWRPIEEMIDSLRKVFGSVALFFYNELAPDVVGVLWRPETFEPHALSVMHSEYAIPIERQYWKSDSLVVRNMGDLLRQMSQYTRDIIADIRVLDDRSVGLMRDISSRKRPAAETDDDSSHSKEA